MTINYDKLYVPKLNLTIYIIYIVKFEIRKIENSHFHKCYQLNQLIAKLAAKKYIFETVV